MAAKKETDLYAPVKTYLEAQGYAVKGEVGAADVVGIRGAEAPVIVELKLSFSLALLHQAVARLAMTDFVYVCVALPKGGARGKTLRDNIRLCRRLGLGVMTVRTRDGAIDVHCDPGPYAPRKSRRKTQSLLREFDRRIGDPNAGGATRHGIVTAYRQDALKCLLVLDQGGPTKASDVAKTANVSKARAIMADNHYGWFEKVERGIYTLSPKGIEAKKSYKTELKNISGNLLQ